MMSAAGEDLASLFGDKSESRRGRLRARVDAGESRAPAAAAFGFPALRPWFSAYPTAAGVGSFLPTSCAPPPLPVWWMSPGLLAASASAHCPVSSDMGVSHMERLAPAPGVNNLMLREILATAGGRGPSASPPSMDAAAGAARRFQTGAAAAADTINGAAGGMDLQPDSSQQQQQLPSTAASPAVDHQLPSVELQSPPASPMGADKKCRLENIVSGIRPSSGSPLPVNGCKKRKLYQPVQHETRTSGGESERDEMEDAMEEDEEESAEVMARRCQSDNMMHGQIQSVQSQLAIMQERYAQLYRNGTNNGELNREGLQQQEMDLSVRTGIRSPVATPEKPARDERPIPALHKIAEENAAGSFIDYARKVLNADHRNNKENERLRTERGGAGDFSSRLLRAAVPDVDGLADTLKSEITSSLAGLIDGIVNKWVQQRRAQAKAAETAEQAAREAYTQQILDQRRSPRAEILRRISQHNGRFPTSMTSAHPFAPPEGMSPFSLSTLSQMRPPGALPPLFQQAKATGFPSTLGGNSYNSPYGLQALRDSFQHHGQQDQDDGPLSLVVTPKKKRHKVTDTRILPRGMGKLFGEDMRPQQVTSSESPSPCSYGAVPPQLLPSSLPTSVAIPNPGLHESQHFFAGYPYYKRPASPPEQRRDSDSPQTSQHPLHHHHHHAASLMHPALIAAGAGQNSPDSMGYMRDTPDRSDGNSIDGSMYDTLQNGINFPGKFDARSGLSLMSEPSTTLTPMHLRKAKLMFFWSRYPSSSILKSFFPDIHFNKNNTAQLVKWFSNFREFFYIQMEKYARQALSEGVKNPEDLTVTSDCELLRVLNLHYNRNNHSEIPQNFPFVAEAALREFLKAIQAGKDAEPSWKKAIYKVIARLDEGVPEYFRSPSFLEQLE